MQLAMKSRFSDDPCSHGFAWRTHCPHALSGGQAADADTEVLRELEVDRGHQQLLGSAEERLDGLHRVPPETGSYPYYFLKN